MMSSPFLVILSIIDIATGALIFHQSFSIFPAIFYYSAYFHLIKGGFTWLGAVAEKNLFEWMGTIDLLGGMAALMIAFKISSPFFPFIGTALALKGVYSLIASVL